MDEDCLIVLEDIKSPPLKAKKLKSPFVKTKQARLPFSPLSVKQTSIKKVSRSGGKPTTGSIRTSDKKRKLSASSDDQQPAAKKNITAKVVDKCSKYRRAPDDEVSSSCDENQLSNSSDSHHLSTASVSKSPSTTDSKKSPAKKQKPHSLMQKFMRREPTQQDEVSTSVKDDKDKEVVSCEDEKDEVGSAEEAPLLMDAENKSSERLLETKESRSVVENQPSSECHIKNGEKNKRKKVSCEDPDSAARSVSKESVEEEDSVLDKSEEEMNAKKEENDDDSEKSEEKDMEDQTKKILSVKELVSKTAIVRLKKLKVATPGGKNGKRKNKFNTSRDSRKKKFDNKANAVDKKESSPKQPNKKRKLNESLENKTENDSSKKKIDVKKPESKLLCNNLITTFMKKGVPRVHGSPQIATTGDKDETATVAAKSEHSSDDGIDITERTKSESSMDNDGTLESAGEESVKPAVNDDKKAVVVAAAATDAVKTTPTAKPLVKAKIKVTPKTLAKELERRMKEEEKAKKREDKLKEKQEKIKKEEERHQMKKEKEDELKRQREEKEQAKEEKIRKKQEELEEKTKEREEKKQKTEEDKKAKGEEKRLKEGEKKRLEQEEIDRKKKVAEKFANFFVASKTEQTPAAATETTEESGPFRQMQVSRNTVLAPVCRCHLETEARSYLDVIIRSSDTATRAPSKPSATDLTYLALLSSGAHKAKSSPATPQVISPKEDKDDCVIIEEKDEDDDDEEDLSLDGDAVLLGAGLDPAKLTGKLLKFCENRRPAYWGTWTKPATVVGPRRPFAKEKIFDYTYDSDDDWEEEEENGESLSDSEGEKDEEEDEQYEVDNEFFVPHGYLSDDEGQEEDDEGNGKKDEQGPLNNKEKLKAKQAEFEKEQKKQTKKLKPRVLGCLWLHQEEQTNAVAYDHLVRVLGSYTAVVCCSKPASAGVDAYQSAGTLVTDDTTTSTTTSTTAAGEGSTVFDVTGSAVGFAGIPCLLPTTPSHATTPHTATISAADSSFTGDAAASGSLKRRFFKSVPEEDIPALIRLLHGNKRGKILLVREFDIYWQKQHSAQPANPATSVLGTPHTPSTDKLSKKKIDVKISELGEYKRCSEEGPFFNQCMWYVEASTRERYGVDALLPNNWTYVGQHPKDNRCTAAPDDANPDHNKTPSAKPSITNTPKTPAASGVAAVRTPTNNLITKFTKVLTEEEKAALNNKKIAASPLINAQPSDGKTIAMDNDDVASSSSGGDGAVATPKAATEPKNTNAGNDESSAKKSSSITTGAKSKSIHNNSDSTMNSGKKGNSSAKNKKKVALLSTTSKRNRKSPAVVKAKGSLMTFLKKPRNSAEKPKLKTDVDNAINGFVKKTENKKSLKPNDSEIVECITLD